MLTAMSGRRRQHEDGPQQFFRLPARCWEVFGRVAPMRARSAILRDAVRSYIAAHGTVEDLAEFDAGLTAMRRITGRSWHAAA